MKNNKIFMINNSQDNSINNERLSLVDCSHESLEQCDAVFNHVDDEHVVGHTRRDVKKSKAKTYGVVVYGDKDIYCSSLNKEEACEENKEIHIFKDEKRRRQVMNLVLAAVVKATGKAEYKDVVQGHEHGEHNGKCHFQMCVFMADETQVFIKPGRFVIEGDTYLYMVQKARNPYALQNYCKKDGDFVVMDETKRIRYVYKLNSKGEKTNKVDAFATVVQNLDKLDKRGAQDLLLAHEPRTAMCQMKNIDYVLDQRIQESLPDFEWNFPAHMDNGKYSLIKKWFTNYCQPEDMLRRKALVILGHRGCGKSEFAERLVNHEAYRVSVSGNFNAKDTVGKTPKILIMDDINHYDDANKECWKRLIVGQTTNINGKYCNLKWDYKVPCIILTNNKKLFKNLILSPEFGSQCMYYAVPNGDFMGPEGTKPEDIDELEVDMPDSLREWIDEERDKREAQKGQPIFDDKQLENMQLRQQVASLKAEMAKLTSTLKKRKRSPSTGSSASGNKKRLRLKATPSQGHIISTSGMTLEFDNDTRVKYNQYKNNN